MSKADQEKIFKEFTQLDTDRMAQKKGSGLGLSISKKLIDMLEGTLELNSRLGHGTSFIIQVPLKGVGEDAVPETERKKEGTVRLSVSDTGVEIEETKSTRTSESKQPKRSAKKKTAETRAPTVRAIRRPLKSPKATKPHILLVDDNEDNRYAMSYFLREKGYHLSMATNGREGIAVAIKEMPDLIFMDVMMPIMDGYEATRALKSKVEFQSIPIVAMTAKAMSYDRDKALKAGYDDYIAKPFTLENVLQKIDNWLE